jgi:hypothetical protein
MPIDHRHFVAQLLQVTGRGHAEQAGAKYNHAHVRILVEA